MNRLGRLVAVLVVVNLVLAGVAVLLGDRSVAPSPPASGALRLAVPDRHAAGEPLTVDVLGIADGVAEIDVVLTTAAGTVRRTLPVDGADAALLVTGDALVAAGPALLWVVAGSDEVTASVAVEPGAAVEPVVPYAGPKSIVTDGVDHAMVVALPADANGNAVPQRTDIVFRAVRPDGAADRPATITTGLVSWTRLTAGIRSGRSVISARLGAVGGPAADVDEVADRPVAVALRWTDAPGTPLVADGRRLHRLATDQITDRNGNVVPDGTAIVLRATEPTGSRQASAMTIDGRAEFFLEAPDAPGPLTATAAVAGVSSEPVSLDFGPAPAEIPVELVRNDTGATLLVGPVTSVIGGWVPDGTVVRYLADGSDTDAVAGVLRDGVATLRLDGLRPVGTLSVLGVDVEVGP